MTAACTVHKPERWTGLFSSVILISRRLPCRSVLDVVSTHVSDVNCKRTVFLSSHMCIGPRYEKDRVWQLRSASDRQAVLWIKLDLYRRHNILSRSYWINILESTPKHNTMKWRNVYTKIKMECTGRCWKVLRSICTPFHVIGTAWQWLTGIHGNYAINLPGPIENQTRRGRLFPLLKNIAVPALYSRSLQLSISPSEAETVGQVWHHPFLLSII